MRFRMAVVMLGLLGSATALADDTTTTGTTTGSLPGGATLDFRRLFLFENHNPATHGGVDPAEPEKVPDSLWFYFNYAHCVCDEPNNRVHHDSGTDPDGHERTFAYEIGYTRGTEQVHRPLQIFTGNDQCQDELLRKTECTELVSSEPADVDNISQTGTVDPPIDLYDFMMPGTSTQDPNGTGEHAACIQRTFDATEWLMVDTDNNSTPDYFQTKVITTDSLPAPTPDTLEARASENAITLKWDVPTGDTSDIYVYQALCTDAATGDTMPALATPSDDPRYMTPHSLCGVDEGNPTYSQVTGLATADGTTSTNLAADNTVDGAAPADAPADAGPAVDAGSGSGSAAPLPEGIRLADPAFICATTTDATATSLRIEGLQNDHDYHVALLVMDKFGNANGVFVTRTLTPKAVTDFWEDLHARGSHVEGGFCLLNETYGGSGPITDGLRAFRDDNLGAHSWMTRAYYASLAKLGLAVHRFPILRLAAGLWLAPLVALALLWHLLTLPGLLALIAAFVVIGRSRRIRKLAVAFAVLVVPRLAAAQPSPDWQPEPSDNSEDKKNEPPLSANATAPYAEAEHREALPNDQRPWDEELVSDVGQPAVVNWHAGIRLGPYIPQIDAQLGGTSPGPYEQMFGGAAVMPFLDVDRIVWRGFGQVGFGGSIGYMSRTANAFTEGSKPTDPNRPRSDGDTNTFRLLPIAATATYRFTRLDDEYGVPIIPYARGGLSYYIWWLDAPNGSTATACIDGSMTPNCKSTKAAGASLGIQASIGIAVRAERIEARAAQAMHDSGIEHAGFYAELSFAKVDGFGSDSKLAVGDTTWFAGVDFEF